MNKYRLIIKLDAIQPVYSPQYFSFYWALLVGETLASAGLPSALQLLLKKKISKNQN